MSTSVFAAIYRHWIWLGVPVTLAALAGLVFTIRGVIVVMRESEIARVPLAPSQSGIERVPLARSLEVYFPEAGPVVLGAELPRFSKFFAHATFELSSMSGERVPGRSSLFRMSTAKVSTMTMNLMDFDIPHPGRYVLRIAGIEQSVEGSEEYFIFFARPHGAKTIGFILGIVLTSCIFIASLVFFLMRVVGVQTNAE